MKTPTKAWLTSLFLFAGTLIYCNAQVSDPEIDIKGNNLSIADGDDSPSTMDYTHFGSCDVNSGSINRQFTIINTGTSDLNLTGISPYISISGDTSDFKITNLPLPAITAQSLTTFGISFDPFTTGTRSATISIANNDNDENPYNFLIQGEGTSAPSVSTDSITGITATGAILHGTVNANNLSTSVSFEYGLTAAYGSATTAAESPVSGIGETTVSSEITGLMPGTRYHVRTTATNSGGSSRGTDLTFTTLIQSASVEKSAAESPKIYPNPASGTAIIYSGNIDLSGNTEILITDLSGKHMSFDLLSESPYTLDVSNSSPGLYCVAIKTSEQTIYLKLVIRK